jgi:hypothetical protein
LHDEQAMRQVLLPALLLAGCAADAALDDSAPTGGKADGATAAQQRIWNFAYIYPEVDSAETAAQLLSLSDLGLDRRFFDAAYGHMSGRFALPGAAADDHPVSPDDPQIIHEECLKDSRSWRVTQVRFAPYQYAIPGTVSALRTWAGQTGSRLDQKIEVRLSVHPFCENENIPGLILREDQAMHLIYAIAPDDAALAADVFASAGDYVTNQLRGTAAAKTASYAALERHRAALSSTAYRAFHKSVVAEWQALGELAPVTDADFAGLDTQAKSLRATGLTPFRDRFLNNPDELDFSARAHPATLDADFRALLSDTIVRYAKPTALERTALMFTVGSQDGLDDFQETRWFFSMITPGAFPQLSRMPAAAAEVYGAFSPAPLDTFVAFPHRRGVDLVRTTSAGFYSESRGVVSGPKRVFPARVTVDGRSVAVLPEVTRVDFVDQPVLDPAQGHDMALVPSGPPLLAAMNRFADVDVANASTTPCDRCHNALNFMRDRTATGYRAAGRDESAYSFHMLTDSSLSLRTVRELDYEAAQAALELADE